MTRGSSAPASKLDEAAVSSIKIALRDGSTTVEALAREHHVNYQTVYAIGTGRSWAHVEPTGRVLAERGVISPERRARIVRWQQKHGATLDQVVEAFGVSRSSASRILQQAKVERAFEVHKALLACGNVALVRKEFRLTPAQFDSLMLLVSKRSAG